MNVNANPPRTTTTQTDQGAQISMAAVTRAFCDAGLYLPQLAAAGECLLCAGQRPDTYVDGGVKLSSKRSMKARTTSQLLARDSKLRVNALVPVTTPRSRLWSWTPWRT